MLKLLSFYRNSSALSRRKPLPLRNVKFPHLFNNFKRNKSDDDGCCSDYTPELGSLINEQITVEFNASVAYLSMSCYFGRNDIAMPGCQGFFLNMHEEEHEHGLEFIKYHMMRGGRVQLCPLHCVKDQNWRCIIHAFSVALEMEKNIKKKIEQIIACACECRDLGAADWLSSKFIQEQDRSICEMSRLLARASLLNGDSIGQFSFDKLLYKTLVKNGPKNTANEVIDLDVYK